MSEWQPIETAPKDKSVELGMWKKGHMYGSPDIWATTFDVARWGILFGILTVRTGWTKDYTHWRPSPPPPQGE